MSYKSIDTNDLTKKYFFDLGNFVNILPQLASAHSEQAWELWFEKLALIDRRSLYRYLKDNVQSLTDEQKDFAEWYLQKRLIEEKPSVIHG